MSAAVVFILFVICLVIAIPVSISLGIVAVLPGAFDSSSQCQLCYPLYARWYRQLPAFSGAYVCACGNRHGTRQNLTKIV